MSPSSAKRHISESMEDYLEAILRLTSGKRVARARDIAARLGVKMPSVSGALKSLVVRGLVNYRPYEAVTLTSAGVAVAKGVARKHQVLLGFLRDILGVNERIAEADACRLEHSLSGDSMRKLGVFMAGRLGKKGMPWRN